LNGPARDKHSSLFRGLVNYGRKKFYHLGSRRCSLYSGSKFRNTVATFLNTSPSSWCTHRWAWPRRRSCSSWTCPQPSSRDPCYKTCLFLRQWRNLPNKSCVNLSHWRL